MFQRPAKNRHDRWSSPAGPLILPVLAQTKKRVRRQRRKFPPLSGRKSVDRCRNRSLSDCQRRGMVFWTKKEVAREKLSGFVQAENRSQLLTDGR